MEKGTVLIVDDNKGVLASLELLLETEFSEIKTATNPNQIISILNTSPVDVIILDMNFKAGINNGNEGLYWLKRIRELQHTIEKAIILCEGDMIRPKDIFVKQTWRPQLSTIVPNLEEVERQAIETAIRQNDGNLTATAEQLGISRQTLYNKIKRFKL